MTDMSVAGPGDRADIYAPVNTYHLLDNCYYCMVAFLSGRTTEQLIRDSEVMQFAGGGTETDIDYLFQCVGMSSAHTYFDDPDSAETALQSTMGNFGVTFFRNDGTGHAVVAMSDGRTITWHDPQINSYDGQSIWDMDGRANGYRFLIYGPY